MAHHFIRLPLNRESPLAGGLSQVPAYREGQAPTGAVGRQGRAAFLSGRVSKMVKPVAGGALTERLVRVADDPPVDLLVATTSGDPDKTLLVIHGGPDWDQMYLRDPLTDLADRRVAFVDLRGCGRSTRGLPDHLYTPELAARDLVQVIEQLGTPEIDVLGFSYGGLIAQRLLLMCPERIRRVILASTSVLPVPKDAFVGWAEYESRQAMQPSRQEEETSSWDEARTRLDAVDSAPSNIWQLDLLPTYLARLDEVRFSADWARPWIAGVLPSPRLSDAASLIAELGKPILLLQGRYDMTFPASLVERTLEIIPSATGIVLDDAGHMAHIDQPQAWLGAVEAFLR